jgi:hypothetical protein
MPLFRRKPPGITTDQILGLQERADALLTVSSLTAEEREVLQKQDEALLMAHFLLEDRHDDTGAMVCASMAEMIINTIAQQVAQRHGSA